MQPPQSSRIDLVELKTQIVKRVGDETSKKYFYCLNRFLRGKLNKSDLDRSCFHLLGRENLSLHNQLIRSILKNAHQSKAPTPTSEAGPTNSAIQTTKGFPSREDGHESSGSLAPNQSQSMSIWSNGVLPVSPRKARSGTRDRKLKDRQSPLVPNGKFQCLSHQSTEDIGNKVVMENGEFPACDFQRPMHHVQAQAGQHGKEREALVQRSKDQLRTQRSFVEDSEEIEQANRLDFTKSPLVAPFGIPFCPASVGGAHRAVPVASGGISCYDSGELYDTETLRKRMEQIAAAQGLGGVSLECANTLNTMLDVYMKRLIRSCVELVGARSACDPRQHTIQKQQVGGKLINCMCPSNHLHMPSQSGPMEVIHENRSHSPISLLDFKVAMELNPQQLGEDWPLLLEKICNHAFED